MVWLNLRNEPEGNGGTAIGQSQRPKGVVIWPGLTSERLEGVGGGVVGLGSKRVTAALQLCWATQGPAIMARDWDTQSGQNPSKISRASCSSNKSQGKSGK